VSHAVLAPGSLVGVIAPAGPPDAARLAQLPALYAAQGYRVRVYPGCHARDRYLAGDDALRLADLHAALADDTVAAIHCARGGYGCMRLLDRIDRELVRTKRKLLIGYSDVTALHALWHHEGVPSLHAPMPTSDLVRDDADADAGRRADRDALFMLLRAGCRSGHTWAPTLDAAGTAGLRVPGVAEGRLVGGNLSLVGHLLGTPLAWPMAGAILFLEDINEEPYRVDRYLVQLHLAGALDAIAGVLLGSFTDADDVRTELREHLVALGKPLVGGWPAGHGTPNRALPLGVRVRLDATAGSLTLLEDFLR
jgi:muramoyltetrapeptide carboxypeptidase